jgi:hypothetical protein
MPMAASGHAPTHLMQRTRMHSDESILFRAGWIAPTGHASEHAPQPVHLSLSRVGRIPK